MACSVRTCLTLSLDRERGELGPCHLHKGLDWEKHPSWTWARNFLEELPLARPRVALCAPCSGAGAGGCAGVQSRPVPRCTSKLRQRDKQSMGMGQRDSAGQGGE